MGNLPGTSASNSRLVSPRLLAHAGAENIYEPLLHGRRVGQTSNLSFHERRSAIFRQIGKQSSNSVRLQIWSSTLILGHRLSVYQIAQQELSRPVELFMMTSLEPRIWGSTFERSARTRRHTTSGPKLGVPRRTACPLTHTRTMSLTCRGGLSNKSKSGRLLVFEGTTCSLQCSLRCGRSRGDPRGLTEETLEDIAIWNRGMQRKMTKT